MCTNKNEQILRIHYPSGRLQSKSSLKRILIFKRHTYTLCAIRRIDGVLKDWYVHLKDRTKHLIDMIRRLHASGWGCIITICMLLIYLARVLDTLQIVFGELSRIIRFQLTIQAHFVGCCMVYIYLVRFSVVVMRYLSMLQIDDVSQTTSSTLGIW